MAHVTPFYQHISPGSRLEALASYPYHDDDQCPVGQHVKASDEWQYYHDELDSQRERCAICAELSGHELLVSALATLEIRG